MLKLKKARDAKEVDQQDECRMQDYEAGRVAAELGRASMRLYHAGTHVRPSKASASGGSPIAAKVVMKCKVTYSCETHVLNM